jgi:hypothetical protein
MSKQGYGHIPEQGFIAFSQSLTQTPWSQIPDLYKSPIARRPDSPVLAEAGLLPFCKTALAWPLQELIAVVGDSKDNQEKLDGNWDHRQRILDAKTHLVSLQGSPAEQAATARVRSNCLLGAGTGQTTLAYTDEVIWGRKQVALFAGSLKEDVTLLDLESLATEIQVHTEALATAIGMGEDNEAPVGSRTVRINAALVVSVSAFNVVHGILQLLLDHSPKDSPAQLQAEALLGTL